MLGDRTLPARIAYGSHKSARMQPVHVDKKVLGDAVKGWAVVLPKHSLVERIRRVVRITSWRSDTEGKSQSRP